MIVCIELIIIKNLKQIDEIKSHPRSWQDRRKFRNVVAHRVVATFKVGRIFDVMKKNHLKYKFR